MNLGVTLHHYLLSEDALFRRWQVVLGILCVSTLSLGAQTATKDSAFRLGFCSQKGADSSVWSRLVETPDVRARISRDPIPHPPLAFRDKDGNYRGRVVLALMVDTTGRVVPGTVAVSESTESRLSLWACAIAGQLSFIPAILGGKLVLTMVDQPLTYFYGEPPPGMTKP